MTYSITFESALWDGEHIFLNMFFLPSLVDVLFVITPVEPVDFCYCVTVY